MTRQQAAPPGPASRRDEGFTLIELLVVIVILGMLAAIAIPAYLAQRQKAWEGAAQAQVKDAAAALESLHVDNGSYAGGGVASNDPGDLTPLTDQGLNLAAPFSSGSGGSFSVTISGPGSSAYCIQASHASHNGVVWVLRSSRGLPEKVGEGTPPVGACA